MCKPNTFLKWIYIIVYCVHHFLTYICFGVFGEYYSTEKSVCSTIRRWWWCCCTCWTKLSELESNVNRTVGDNLIRRFDIPASSSLMYLSSDTNKAFMVNGVEVCGSIISLDLKRKRFWIQFGASAWHRSVCNKISIENYNLSYGFLKDKISSKLNNTQNNNKNKAKCLCMLSSNSCIQKE